MTQSISHCSFLRVFEIRDAFSEGDLQRGLEGIKSLKPAWQDKTHACLRSVGSQSNFGSALLQEGRVRLSVSQQDVVDALSLFLKEYVRDKIAKETAEAQNDQFLTFVDKLKAARDGAPIEEKRIWETYIENAQLRKPATPFANASFDCTGIVFHESQLVCRPGVGTSLLQIGYREIGMASSFGKRHEMEDRTVFGELNAGVPAEFYALCDGHGGKAAAEYVKRHLEKYLHDSLQRFNSEGLSDEGIFAALKDAFIRLDRDFTIDNSGSTVTLALILKNSLWVANLGDSRSVLNNGGQAIQLTEDQKCFPKYTKKVIERGGVILALRVNRVLDVPRAIGDHGVEGHEGVRVVSPIPKITKFPMDAVPENGALILASDGLWDVCLTQEAVDFVQGHLDCDAGEIARRLIAKAYHAGSKDNLSAIVVRFKKE